MVKQNDVQKSSSRHTSAAAGATAGRTGCDGRRSAGGGRPTLRAAAGGSRRLRPTGTGGLRGRAAQRALRKEHWVASFDCGCLAQSGLRTHVRIDDKSLISGWPVPQGMKLKVAMLSALTLVYNNAAWPSRPFRNCIGKMNLHILLVLAIAHAQMLIKVDIP